MPAGAKPGERRGGRKKGTPNKITVSVKEAIYEAFNKAGGAAYLHKVAMEDPKTFCVLLGKVLPTEITTTDDKPVVVTWQQQ